MRWLNPTIRMNLCIPVMIAIKATKMYPVCGLHMILVLLCVHYLSRMEYKKLCAKKSSYCRYVWTNAVSFWFGFVLLWFDLIWFVRVLFLRLLILRFSIFDTQTPVRFGRHWNFHFLALLLPPSHTLSLSFRRTALPVKLNAHCFNQSRSDHCKTNNNKTKSEQNNNKINWFNYLFSLLWTLCKFSYLPILQINGLIKSLFHGV